MRFLDIQNSSPTCAGKQSSVLICASGYEARARSCLDLLSDFRGRRVTVGFLEHQLALARPENDRQFSASGCEMRLSAGESADAVEHLMAECVPADDANPRCVVVDISSMSKVWYAAIIRYLLRLRRSGPVTVFFLYTPGVFAPPPVDTAQSEVVVPIHGFAGLSLPNRPIALIIGLGYEPERALALRELLDPALTIAFLPSARQADGYSQFVIDSNTEVLSEANEEWRFEYQLADPSGTFRVLESIVNGLVPRSRLVAAPLGPKLFALLCLLAGSKHPELSVWRVSAGAGLAPRDIAGDPSGAVVCRTEWA